MTEQDRPPQTFDKLSREQLEIYAKELAAHVQTERGLRKELERHNRQLEQRVREITALNRLFQKHLDERQAVVTAYREVLVGLKELVKGGRRTRGVGPIAAASGPSGPAETRSRRRAPAVSLRAVDGPGPIPLDRSGRETPNVPVL